MTDFIGHSDADFDAWQENFVIKVNLYKATWGLSADALTEWTFLTVTAGDKKAEWVLRWATVKSGEFTHSDVVFKNSARHSYESGDINNPEDTSLRMFINRYIRYNPLVSDGQKADIGITIPSEQRTPAPGVDGSNVMREVAGQLLKNEHLFQLSQVNTPGVKSLAKGTGVDGIEIFIAITPITVTVSPAAKEYAFDGESKGGYYKRQFDDGQEELKAWYKARKRFKGRTKTWGPFSKPWWGVIS